MARRGACDECDGGCGSPARLKIWRSHKNDPGALLRGTLLEEAKSYVDFTPLERSYVDASVAATEEAAAENERVRRREVADAHALATEQARRADEQARAAATLARKNRWLMGLAVLAVVLLSSPQRAGSSPSRRGAKQCGSSRPSKLS